MANKRLFTSVAKYDAMIEKVEDAIDRVVLLGEENENNSGGSSRKMRDTRLEELTDFLARLNKEKAELEGNSEAIFTTPGW